MAGNWRLFNQIAMVGSGNFFQKCAIGSGWFWLVCKLALIE